VIPTIVFRINAPVPRARTLATERSKDNRQLVIIPADNAPAYISFASRTIKRRTRDTWRTRHWTVADVQKASSDSFDASRADHVGLRVSKT